MAKAVFANMGADGVFGRSDIAAITKNKDNARYRPCNR
jgi:ATP-dependent DNA helicase RecG